MNQQLLDRLRNVSSLPSLPAVALRVLELVRQDTTGVADVARVISGDPALAAKLLRTVNSSFYGLPMQVGTISHAATLLGLQSVKTLALGFSLASMIKPAKGESFDFDRFWRQSLYAAVAARSLAKYVRLKECEEAFVAGLLSDIGTVVMYRVLGREYEKLLEASNGDQTELVRLSREKFDLDHAQVGGMLAEHWKLPPLLVEPIRQHHNLADPHIKSKSLVEVVHVAVICAQVFASEVTGLLRVAKNELRSRFQLDETAIIKLFSQIDAQSKPLAAGLDVRIEGARNLAEIEEEAREILMQLTLSAQLQSQEVQRLNNELQQQANTDGLTGLANRARFSQFLQCAFVHSQSQHQPLSLLFLDLDHFKSINDRYGHQAGDEVLMRLAKLLQSQVRKTELVARYGGEEMVIVMPGAEEKLAMSVAQRIQKALASEQFSFYGQTIPLTVSIGVAVNTPGSAAFESPEALVKAADESVYAAKAAGRNCVQIRSTTLRAA
jgi:diguanylate cyclase (GGDEF)-like protein